uniref:Xenotropic and polytropic retrovirus receptor 1 n=1 Tax=Sipha flava TaxID=143950 RepID=A0A2S2QX19_9HEMI
MKFAEHLAAHITPEWRKQYISYEEMKEMLYAAVEQVPAPDQVDPDSLSRYYAKFDEKFFSFCDKELAKINTFYSGFELHLRFCLISTSVCFFAFLYYCSTPFSPSVVLITSCACYGRMNVTIYHLCISNKQKLFTQHFSIFFS